MGKGRGRRWGPRRGAARRRGAGFKRISSRAVQEEQDEDDEVITDTDVPAAIAPDAPLEMAQLTAEQQVAAQRALHGESLFLTGAAGTGKSFLLRYLVQELERLHPSGVAVTAPTGIAASHIGGQTIHSFAGVGLGVGSSRQLLSKVKKSAAAVERWNNARVLVLDEISMLDADLFDALGSIASSVRNSRKPFGGLQLLICGDFLQLPPVQTRGEGLKRFAFQSMCWRQCGLDSGTVVLKEAVRQSKDPLFVDVLNEVRMGEVSLLTAEVLAACHESVKPPPRDSIVPTKLYCLNKNVDAENAARLARLPGTAVVIRARDHFKRVGDRSRRASLSDLLDKKVPAQLKLKVGAQVILTKNQPVLGLVNGSRGVVESFEEGRPLVRFDGGQHVHIGRERFEHGRGSGQLIRIQVPLKLGWALTVHKAQGMTLSRAELQIDDAFESGQAYVALSRLTDLAGLWVRGGHLSAANVRAHPDVLDFYNNITLPNSVPFAAGGGIGTASAFRAAVPRLSPTPARAVTSKLVQEVECYEVGVPKPNRGRKRAAGLPPAVAKLAKHGRLHSGTISPPVFAVEPELSMAETVRCAETGRLHCIPVAPPAHAQASIPEALPANSQLDTGTASAMPSKRFQGWITPPKTWGGGVIDLD